MFFQSEWGCEFERGMGESEFEREMGNGNGEMGGLKGKGINEKGNGTLGE